MIAVMRTLAYQHMYLLLLLLEPVAPAAAQSPAVSITIHAQERISRVSPYMVGSAVEYLNHQVYGFGLYAQMVYGESMEEPPVGLAPPGPPLPPPPSPSPPSPPGPACRVSALTNDSSILNPYCQTHAVVRTNGLCNIKCPGSGAVRADHCRSTGWEKTISELCGTASTVMIGTQDTDAPADGPYPYPGCPNPDNHSVSGMWQVATTSTGNSSQLQGGAFNGQFFQRISAAPGGGHFGIVNRGLYCESGMFLVGGREYEGSVYLRSTADTVVTVTLVEVSMGAAGTVQSNNGPTEAITMTAGSKWARYNFSLSAAHNSSCPAGAERPGHPELGGIITCTGGLMLSVSNGSTVDIDMVTLMPAAWGRLSNSRGQALSTRLETASALADEGLGVIRMGGSMTAESGYRWKFFAPRVEERQPCLVRIKRNVQSKLRVTHENPVGIPDDSEF